MDSRQMEMFLAVVEFGGYKKAGERLNLSHSAIHRQIRLLEHELNDRLFKRVGKHVHLTESGSILVEHAQVVRRSIEHAKDAIRTVSKMEGGTLRVGTATPLLVDFVPTLLKRFRKKYPLVQITAVTGNVDNLSREVKLGNLELAIIFIPTDAPRQFPAVRYEPLFTQEFVLAVSRRHPFAKRKSVPIQQLVTCNFIMYSKGSALRQSFDRLFLKAGIVPLISMELENEMFIEKMIQIDLGVAFLSKRRVTQDRINYTRIKDYPIKFEVGLIFPLSSYTRMPAQEFARMSRELSKELALLRINGVR